MSLMTEAYATATQTDPARLALLIRLVLGAVAFALLGQMVLQLWDAHQAGELRGASAGAYFTRALVLVLVLAVVVR
jgi:hypothetical protein